jgi:hypothetical protein
MEDVGRTIISQYGNSPTLGLLIEAANQWLDPGANIDTFYADVWNIATAQGYGLDIWGRIVGVQRVLTVSAGKYWGYKEAGTTSAEPYYPGGHGAFYSGQAFTSNFALSDQSFRLLILAKAASNISDGSISSINAIMMALFPGRGFAWVVDNLNMSLTYTFAFLPVLTPVELAILGQSGVLPRPTGVSTSITSSLGGGLLGTSADTLTGVGSDLLTGTLP